MVILTLSKPSPGMVPVMPIQGTVAPGVKPPQNELTISTSEPPPSSKVCPCDDGLTVALQKLMKKNPWAGIDWGKLASVTWTVKPELGPAEVPLIAPAGLNDMPGGSEPATMLHM